MADFDNDHTQEIREAVENYFEREEARYQPFDENNVARASYAIRTKMKSVNSFFMASSDLLIIKMVLPLNVDEEERSHVAEFLMRANYGLKIGGFDFDFRDGEISYRVTIYCGEEEFVPPTYEQIDNAVMVSLAMIHRYSNALLKIMFGLIEPEEAIELAEND